MLSSTNRWESRKNDEINYLILELKALSEKINPVQIKNIKVINILIDKKIGDVIDGSSISEEF